MKYFYLLNCSAINIRSVRIFPFVNLEQSTNRHDKKCYMYNAFRKIETANFISLGKYFVDKICSCHYLFRKMWLWHNFHEIIHSKNGSNNMLWLLWIEWVQQDDVDDQKKNTHQPTLILIMKHDRVGIFASSAIYRENETEAH